MKKFVYPNPGDLMRQEFKKMRDDQPARQAIEDALKGQKKMYEYLQKRK